VGPPHASLRSGHAGIHQVTRSLTHHLDTENRSPRAALHCATVMMLVLILGGTLGCRRPAREGELIDKYKAAACVPPLREPKHITPPTREWEHVVKTEGGVEVVVAGAQSPGGRISAT
jgi:hypothetical protein